MERQSRKLTERTKQLLREADNLSKGKGDKNGY